MTDYSDRLKKDYYTVKDCPYSEGKRLVERYHYTGGGSTTRVYMHGLYDAFDDLIGVAWWIPPTKVVCQSVNKDNWKKVLCLTRLVVVPSAPKNACSFLLSASMRIIRKEKRFVSLVTYADESQGHSGTIYKATNWKYEGRTGPYVRWVDAFGRQVSIKATKTRTKKQMLDLGYVEDGKFFKHKFVTHF